MVRFHGRNVGGELASMLSANALQARLNHLNHSAAVASFVSLIISFKKMGYLTSSKIAHDDYVNMVNSLAKLPSGANQSVQSRF